MKRILQIITIVLITFIILVFIPFLINMAFKVDFHISLFQSEWSAGDALNFYGAFLSFVGTTILGIVSIWQTKKANNLSEKLLKNSLIESTTIPHLQNKIDIDFKENNDRKITMSTDHKMDHGAIIAIEPYDEDTEKFNQYLINLYFKCSGMNNNIKEITIDNILCIQDPSKDGFHWEDNSDTPIPLKLNIYMNNRVYLNWIDSADFFIQIKTYCEPDKFFDNMIRNDENLCIMFEMEITGFNGLKTKMHYKIWLQKFQGINVIKTNSTFLENYN